MNCGRLYWKDYALVYPGQLVSADLRRPRFIGRRSHSRIRLKGPGKIKGIGKAAGKRRVFTEKPISRSFSPAPDGNGKYTHWGDTPSFPEKTVKRDPVHMHGSAEPLHVKVRLMIITLNQQQRGGQPIILLTGGNLRRRKNIPVNTKNRQQKPVCLPFPDRKSSRLSLSNKGRISSAPITGATGQEKENPVRDNSRPISFPVKSTHVYSQGSSGSG